MKLSIKTLQGKSYALEADASSTVEQVKQIIEKEHSLTASKLIHAGKILKDDQTLQGAGIKENGFLVCMVAKKKEAAPAPAPAPAPVAAPAAPAPAAAPTPAAAPAPAATPEPAPAAPAPAPEAAAPAAAAAMPGVDPAQVENLVAMGFPKDQCEAALRAAFGDPSRAVEYLMNGIPESAAAPAPAPAPTAAPAGGAAPAAGGNGELEVLRQHPQFNDLRRLVQSNPQALPAVLQQIGQQDAGLLAIIQRNQQAFIDMMNEPIAEGGAAAAPPAGAPAGAPAGGPNPAQLMQAVSQMPPEQQQQMAAAMGINPQQLQAVAQMMNQLPPGALQQMMAQGGMPGMPGGAPGGQAQENPNVIRLTEEEGAAVDRLAEMGFDKHEAAQAYLACDKNEMLAANFLFENQMND